MSHTILAAVCREFGKPLQIEQVHLAEPHREEVLVAVKACAVCHSDISYADGDWGGGLPAVYGHEAAGIVEAVGPEVNGVSVGDHVAVTLIRSCGVCSRCLAGREVLCDAQFSLDNSNPITGDGEVLVQSMRTGAFAQKVLVHRSQVVAVPSDLGFDVASLLACGVLTGFGAVANTAQVGSGQGVAIIGCGGVGLNAVQAAAIRGANPIVAVDLSPSKLEAAKRFGATHVFDPASGSAAEFVADLTGGRGLDFVFVTVGAKPALDGAFAFIGKGGTAVIVGMPATGVQAEYDPATLASWSQRILGSKMGDAVVVRDIPMLVDLYRDGALQLDELITGRYRLEDINEAIQSVKRGDALRNVVLF